MTTAFNGRAKTIAGPAEHAFAITPDDDNDLGQFARAIYVGGSGAIAITLPSGDDVVLSGVAAGTLLPIRVARLKATGTTATHIVGLV